MIYQNAQLQNELKYSLEDDVAPSGCALV